MELTAGRVEELFNECMSPTVDGALVVEGVINTVAFQRDAIEQHKPEIAKLLAELPDMFRESGGGGWSFLNACIDRHNRQWTGLHLIMEQLFLLGLASEQVVCLMPRDMWGALPGGMPYYMVKL